ncbi:MAG: outer membrane transport family protein [Micavibrio sp.]|nr:outer membrane transport family protein [Micavibrio sp.]
MIIYIVKKAIFLPAFLSGVLFIAPHTYAAGFYIQEQSVKGLGSAFSNSVTSLKDASTVFFNPAGMTDLEGAQINIGTHILFPSANLTNTGSTFFGAPIASNNGGNPYSATPVPNFYATTPLLDNKIWMGLGINAPFGLANDYNDGWFGRYDSTKTELTTINISPVMAFKATDWLSIGGGLDAQYTDAVLESAISNVVSEGVSKLEGDDWSFGYNIGIKLKPLKNTTIGAHYRSAISHTLDGRISVQGLSAGNFNIAGTANLNLPDIATFGVTQDISDRFKVFGQAAWFGWNNFEDIHAKNTTGGTISNIKQNYQTTWTFAVGGEYDINEDWTVRAGYQYDATPTRDLYRTSRTPDGDRNWFSTGATYNIRPNLELDMAATYIDISSEKINLNRNSGLANITANTDGSVGILALGLNYKF